MEKNNTLAMVIAVGVIIIAALLIWAKVPQGEASTITVQGSYEKEMMPDKAELWFGIETNSSSALEAQTKNKEITQSIIDALKTAGVLESDMETINYNMYPRQIWDEKTYTYKTEGYSVSNTIKLNTKDFSKIGSYIDLAVRNGATNINSVSFSLSTEIETAEKADALKQASLAAKSKAESMAEPLGAKITKIKSVSESNFYYRPYDYMMKGATVMEQASNAAAVPILPQKVSITADVTVVYEIR